MRNYSILFLVFVLSLNSCIKTEVEDLVVEGAVPVYAQIDLSKIKSSEVREMSNTSNFILYDSYILIIEKFQGVHVVDNTNPAAPVNISFIVVPGITQLTASNNVLYVNFGSDLVSIDISDILNVSVITSVSQFFSEESLRLYPENYFGYFECVDMSKGVIVEWNLEILTNPQCRIF